MMSVYCLIFLFVSLSSTLSAIWEYDRAIFAGQKGDWQKSSDLLARTLAYTPDDPSLLYDAGVSAYNSGQFDAALSYFTKAGQCDQAPALIKEQAFFNAGNTQVKLKKLEQALKEYEKVFALNPSHERARHNYEQVKKMLEQKKEQEKNEDSDQKKDEQKNDQKDQNNNKSDQSNDNEDGRDSQDQSEKSAHEQQKNDQKNKDGKDQKDDQGPQQNNQKKSGEQQKNDANDDQSMSKEQEDREARGAQEQPLEPQLVRMLAEQDKKDAQAHKKLMKAQYQQQGGVHEDHYSW